MAPRAGRSDAHVHAFPAGAFGPHSARCKTHRSTGRHTLDAARRSRGRSAAECHAQGRHACSGRCAPPATLAPYPHLSATIPLDIKRGRRTMESTRRGMMTAAAAAAAVAAVAAPKAFAAWEPTERYPDPSVQVLDPAFNKYRLGLASVERIATGMRWCEGPVYMGDWRCLLWSDIPNNRIMRWDEETGRVSVYRKPSNNANGNTRDRQGRLVTCEHDTRRVTRTEYDGGITVLADKFDGKPLNSPNDIVVKSDDSIWFTDPPFGILGNYEGHVDKPELPTNIYRLDKAGRATVATGEVNRP